MNGTARYKPIRTSLFAAFARLKKCAIYKTINSPSTCRWALRKGKLRKNFKPFRSFLLLLADANRRDERETV